MKLFFLFLCNILIFTGCNNKYENSLKGNIAEIREFLMEGKSEEVTTSLICGKREKDYVINGYATSPIEFGVLTFKLDNIKDFDVSLANFILLVGTIRYDGVLGQNPFDQTLVADIGKIVDKKENIVAKLIIGEYSKEIKLNLINKDWKVDSNRVIEIVANNYKKDLDNYFKNNIFCGEVYIKILNDADIYKGDYYWYVSIISKKGDNISLIISPYTGEILASSVKLIDNENILK